MSQQAPPAFVFDPEPAAPALKSFTGYQVFMIVILALLHFTIILDFMIISPLGDLLIKELTLSPAQFGSVVSAYALSAGVSGILAAGFADRFDRKKILLFFYGGFFLGTLFCGLAWSYTTLFIARLITGVFGGVMISIIMAIMTDVFELHQRGRVMGFVQMSFAGSQILGIPLGIWLANQWGWHSTFYMVAGLAFVIGILIILRVKPLDAHLAIQRDKKPVEHLLHTIRKKEYHIGFFAIAMLSLGGFLLMPFSAPFLVNNVDVTQESLPVVFFFTGLSAMVMMPLIGRLSDRLDKFRIFLFGSILAGIMIVVYTNLTPIPLWFVILINVILFMGIFSRMVPAMALHTAIPDPADRGAYMSITSSLQQMAGGLAAMLAGIVVVQETTSSPIQHFNSLGYVMVGIMAVCLILVWKMNQYVKTKEQKQLDV